MDKVQVEEVTPLRFAQDRNVIICETSIDCAGISQALNHDINGDQDDHDPVESTMYALSVNGKPWNRAMIKFRRVDGMRVFQLLDRHGNIDLDPLNVRVRKIKDPALLDMKIGQFKLIIYAVAKYECDKELISIFDQTVRNRQVTCLSGLIEPKPMLRGGPAICCQWQARFVP